MRILIVGFAGSGKSTLAERISKKFGIPHLHIDRVWLELGGHAEKDSVERERIRGLVKERVERSLQQSAWVSDGWQAFTAERADSIVFLDISLARRMVNLLYRMFFDRKHKEISFWDDVKFLFGEIGRTRRMSPELEAFVKEYRQKITVLRNYNEVENYFRKLEP